MTITVESKLPEEIKNLLHEIIDFEINMAIEYGGTAEDSKYRESLEKLKKRDVTVEDILKYARREIFLMDLIKIYDCSAPTVKEVTECDE